MNQFFKILIYSVNSDLLFALDVPQDKPWLGLFTAELHTQYAICSVCETKIYWGRPDKQVQKSKNS